MKNSRILFLILMSTFIPAMGQELKPIEVIERVADRIISEVDFSYRIIVPKPDNKLNSLKCLDFGREFGHNQPAVAYALTSIISENDRSLMMELSHNDGLKIWLNDSMIYVYHGDRSVIFMHGERGFTLDTLFNLPLKKGVNKLLIKSETKGGQWIVYMQPEGSLIESADFQAPYLGLKGIPDVDTSVSKISTWLIAGPFQNPANGNKRTGLQREYSPEKKIVFGEIWHNGSREMTWTVPRIDIFTDVKNPDPLWGSYYNYNYHTAGLAWAMMQLADYTANKTYDEYAKHYTDFMLGTKPLICFQVKDLHGFNSVNQQMVDTPLLDFTLAPSLPFIYRLVRDNDFPGRPEYTAWVEDMIWYAEHIQSRAPEGNFNRSTPKVYTTWTDDMFMGLPFLILASEYTSDPAQKEHLRNDAARQVNAFDKKVFNTTDHLYQHAQYSDRAVKMPYWSRANGWAIWAVTEVLKQLPVNSPLYKPILNHFREHVDALIRYQDPKTGFWNNVLDVPASGPETSGTAIFTMAIARGINEGWLNREKYEPYALKGWKALDSVTDSLGNVHGICMGTMCSEDLMYYLNRPIVDNDSHGMLGLIVAGIEVQKMLDRDRQNR